MGLSVVIPSRTDANLVPCMEAVREHEPACRLIVVDDGLSLDWLPRPDLAPAIGIRGEKPFIFSRNCNAGIALAGDDDVVLLNDDALLEDPGGLSLLQRAADQNREYGVISAVTNLVGNTAQFPRGFGLRSDPVMVCFVCVLIPRRTIDLVGMLDERFTEYGYEDNDYCRRVRNAGLAIGIHDGCRVDHRRLKSTFRPDGRMRDIEPAARIYAEKWGDLR